MNFFMVSRTRNLRYNKRVDYRSVILVEEKSFFRCTAKRHVDNRKLYRCD